jgi:hypothetical protein
MYFEISVIVSLLDESSVILSIACRDKVTETCSL